MRYRKFGLKAFGLSVIAALGVMAFMAGGAQANWLVLHKGVLVEPDVTVKVKTHQEGNLLVKEETNLEILCATVKASSTSPLLLLKESTTAHGKVEFTTCKTWQGGKEKAGCKPIEPIVAGGLALLVLHRPTPAGSLENYVLLEPDPGVEEFAVIKFNGATCALPEKNKVTGEALAECGDLSSPGVWQHLDCKNHEVTHLLREVPETEPLFEHKLKYGTKKALIDGIADLLIEGPELYVGDEWGGHI